MEDKKYDEYETGTPISETDMLHPGTPISEMNTLLQENNTPDPEASTSGKKDSVYSQENYPIYNKGFKKGMLTMAIICIITFFGLGLIIALAGGLSDEDKIETSATAAETVLSGEGDSGEEDLDAERIQTKMDQIQAMIDEYYLFEQDPEWIEMGIYAGMVAGLGDTYSVYYNEEQFAELMESTEGTYCGIGVMVNQDLVTGVITIIKVFPNAPGAKAGLLPEDMIVAVDGTEVSGMDLDLVVSQYVKGEEGTQVTITVYRPSIGEYLNMTMNRQIVENPTVEYQMLEGKIGLITITQFDLITPSQFKLAMDDLNSQGMKKLIVDLRGNPGGVLDAVVDTMDYLLPDHLGIYARTGDYTSLIYTEDKNGNGESYSAGDGHELSIPMAVLVNGNSASAAEVFAGTMQDYGWATIVGTTTYGKGIVQNIYSLGDGTGLKLTTSRYFTPSGVNIHGTGITPDVEIELDPELATRLIIEPEEDNQLQKAIEVLTTGEGMNTPMEESAGTGRVLTDGQAVCTNSPHMAVKYEDVAPAILDVIEASDYSVWCQWDYASEENDESGNIFRSHMVQYVMDLKGTVSGYEIVSLDLDKGTGELHYFSLQLSERTVAEEVIRCFMEAAAAACGETLEEAVWIGIRGQMEALQESGSFTLESDYFYGQVSYFQGMYMATFVPAE